LNYFRVIFISLGITNLVPGSLHVRHQKNLRVGRANIPEFPGNSSSGSSSESSNSPAAAGSAETMSFNISR
jgi:hypothetical protein